MLPKETRTLARWVIVVAVAVIIVPLVISLLLSWLNTGSLRVMTSDNLTIKNIRYCQATCTNTLDNPTKLAKGDYVINVELSDGTIFSSPATIKGSGEETKLQATSQLRTPTIFSMNTLRYTLPLNESFLTYNSNNQYVIGNGATIPLTGIVTAQYTNNHTIVLIGPEDERTPQRNVSYDTNTRSVTPIQNTFPINTENTYEGADGIYATSVSGNQLSLIKIAAPSTQKFDIPASESVLFTSSTAPIFAVNGGVVAFLSTDRNSREQVIDIYALKDFSKLKTIKSNIRGSVSGLSLSPDGKTVIELADEEYSHVYEVSSGTERFKMNADGTPRWVDNSSFIYTSNLGDSGNNYSAGGVYVVDLKNPGAQSIIQRSAISNVRLDAVVDGKIYLSSTTAGAGDYRFVSYMVNLTQPDSAKLSPERATLLSKLPYISSTSSIWYTIDKNAEVTLHAKITVGSKNAVVATLSRLGFNPGDYPIVFENSPNPFGER